MAITMDTDLLRAKVLQLLGEVGMKIEHDELTAIMLAKGCKQLPTGRLSVPAELVAEFIAYQELSRAEDDDDQKLLPMCGPDWAHWLIWTGQKEELRRRMASEFLMPAFDCGPTQLYDYPSRSFRALTLRGVGIYR